MLNLLISLGIKKQILGGFLVLTAFMIAAFGLSVYYLNEMSLIREARDKLSHTHVKVLSLIHAQNHFIINELTDTLFYTSGTNPTLQMRKQLLDELLLVFSDNSEQIESLPIPLRQDLDSIKVHLGKLDNTFSKLVGLYRTKGFKNWGIIGNMRSYAHILEDNRYLSNEDLLMLRRHEKDFLLREDAAYVSAFERRYRAARQKLLAANAPNAQAAIRNLDGYEAEFAKMVAISQTIGAYYEGGLEDELAKQELYLVALFEKVFGLANQLEAAQTIKMKRGYLVSAFALLTFSLLMGLYTSSRISRPIRLLAESVKRNIRSGSTRKIELEHQSSEIANLTNAFNQLLGKVEQHMREIREKSEDLEIRNNELDHFVYSTSHDLKAPISSTLGLINIYRLENDEKQRDIYLGLMEKSLQKLNLFIADIANVSRNARLAVKSEPIDFKDLLNEIFDQQQFIAGAKEVNKQVEIEQHQVFYSDRKRLEVVLANLVSNAIKYSNLAQEQPYIHIHVAVQASQASIRIADNGTGIPSEHLPYIFDMFYRATENNSGSGLGLYIVKQTMDKLGGTVSIESVLGKGTTISLHLPNHVPPPTFSNEKKELSPMEK